MSEKTIRIDLDFNGRVVPCLHVEPKGWCWPARWVGHALDYSGEGRALLRTIHDMARAGLLEEGKDFDILRGEALSLIKTRHKDMMSPRCPSLVVLYESGVHAVSLFSPKKEARLFWQRLVREIMPQIKRDNRYDPSRSVVGGKVVDWARTSKGGASREDAADVVDADQTNAAPQLLDRGLEQLERAIAELDAGPLRVALRLEAAEVATGRDLRQYKSALTDDEDRHDRDKPPTTVAMQTARTHETLRAGVRDALRKQPGQTRTALEKVLGIGRDDHFLFLHVVRKMVAAGELVECDGLGRANVLSLASIQLGLGLEKGLH